MWIRRLQFHATVRTKRTLFAIGKFAIAALHGFPKSVTVHGGKELPMHRIPARSTKADAKRAMHANMEELAGRPLTWKRARQMANALLRDARQAAPAEVDMSQFGLGNYVAIDPAPPTNAINLTKQPWWKRIFGRAA